MELKVFLHVFKDNIVMATEVGDTDWYVLSTGRTYAFDDKGRNILEIKE